MSIFELECNKEVVIKKINNIEDKYLLRLKSLFIKVNSKIKVIKKSKYAIIVVCKNKMVAISKDVAKKVMYE